VKQPRAPAKGGPSRCVRRSRGSRSLNQLREIPPSVVWRRNGEGKAALPRLAAERSQRVNAAAFHGRPPPGGDAGRRTFSQECGPAAEADRRCFARELLTARRPGGRRRPIRRRGKYAGRGGVRTRIDRTVGSRSPWSKGESPRKPAVVRRPDQEVAALPSGVHPFWAPLSLATPSISSGWPSAPPLS
jgi:hypothetical protein